MANLMDEIGPMSSAMLQVGTERMARTLALIHGVLVDHEEARLFGMLALKEWIVGMTLMQRHPEWAQAMLAEVPAETMELAMSSALGIVERCPAEVRDGAKES